MMRNMPLKRAAPACLLLLVIIAAQARIWKASVAQLRFNGIKPEIFSSQARLKPVDYRQALARMVRAEKLDPLSSAYPLAIGESFLNIFENKELLDSAGIFLCPQFLPGSSLSVDILPEAEKYLLSALALEPTNAFCHLKLGLAYIYSGKDSLALQELEKAGALWPADAQLHYEIADYYAKLGIAQSPQSVNEYRQAMSFADSKLQSEILERNFSGDPAGYEQLRKIVPDTDKARFVFAEFLREKKLYDQSLLELQRSAALAQESHNRDILRDSYNWIGIIYFLKGEFTPAVEYLNKAYAFIGDDNKYKAWVLSNLGLSKQGCPLRVGTSLPNFF